MMMSLSMQLLTAGSAACFADLLTFPLDTVKVRLQIQGEKAAKLMNVNDGGVIRTLRQIIITEGAKSLYKGLIPGLQRQMAFSGIRIGAYETVKQCYMHKTGFESGLGMHFVRISAGITTGTLAILVAQPTDVVKIRMQAEATVVGRPTRYKGVFDAYLSIAKYESMAGLYKGMIPNIYRNCIINIAEIVVYDTAKDSYIYYWNLKDDICCHFLAAITAGFTATLVASPVDVVKTRYMNSSKGQYRGAMDCAIQTAKNEGFPAFYKGFNASFSRLVSWNICLWMIYEQMKLYMTKMTH